MALNIPPIVDLVKEVETINDLIHDGYNILNMHYGKPFMPEGGYSIEDLDIEYYSGYTFVFEKEKKQYVVFLNNDDVSEIELNQWINKIKE